MSNHYIGGYSPFSSIFWHTQFFFVSEETPTASEGDYSLSQQPIIGFSLCTESGITMKLASNCVLESMPRRNYLGGITCAKKRRCAVQGMARKRKPAWPFVRVAKYPSNCCGRRPPICLSRRSNFFSATESVSLHVASPNIIISNYPMQKGLKTLKTIHLSSSGKSWGIVYGVGCATSFVKFALIHG